MTTTITNRGKSLYLRHERGKGFRFYQYEINPGVFRRVAHKGHWIDEQLEQFEIRGYVILVDVTGAQIQGSQTEIIRIAIKDNSFDQLFSITGNPDMSVLSEISRRAMNGMFEYEFGEGFVPFDPSNNMEPIQPVEFDLSASGSDILALITDGSPNRFYSLDKGVTWSDVNDTTILTGVENGRHNVSIKDDTSNWFRTKEVHINN